MNIFSILALGLLLGIRHATDADHVVAVSTIVSKQRKLRSASVIGMIWGLGHTITIFIVGSMIIVWKVVIPPRLGLLFESFVALALIVLGILNLTGIMQKIIAKLSKSGQLHTHIHFHDTPHVHVHKHEEQLIENPGKHEKIQAFIRDYGIFQLARPFIVGLVHGLAGSAAIALLVLGSVNNPAVGLVYLLIFGIGTVIGMMIITTGIGIPIIVGSNRFKRIDRFIVAASGVLSITFGLYLIYQIGFVDGLFTDHPTWDPR